MTSSKPRHIRSVGGRGQPERLLVFPAGAQKPREHGSTKEIVLRGIKEMGGYDAVAAFFGIGSTTAAAMADDARHEQMSFDRVLRLTRFCGVKAFAEALAAAAGGVFIPAPEADGRGLPALSAESNSEMAEFVASALDALADGKITMGEARVMAAKFEPLMHTLGLIQTQLNAMIRDAGGG